jgi:hypothetical protein
MRSILISFLGISYGSLECQTQTLNPVGPDLLFFVIEASRCLTAGHVKCSHFPFQLWDILSVNVWSTSETDNDQVMEEDIQTHNCKVWLGKPLLSALSPVISPAEGLCDLYT